MTTDTSDSTRGMRITPMRPLLTYPRVHMNTPAATAIVITLNRMHMSRNGIYPRLTTKPSAALTACWIIPRVPIFFSRCRPWARWQGSIKIASIHEMLKTVITTSGITRQNLPIVPGMKYSGRNATMLVKMLKVTGKRTFLVPRTAASAKGIPSWRYS